jgi:hypothetical protein
MKNVTVDVNQRLGDNYYRAGAAVVTPDQATALDAAGGTTIGADYALPTEADIQGNSVAFLKTASGNTTLLPATEGERIVHIDVLINTTFAAGDGAAPIFDIGETDTGEKFKANLNSGTAGTLLSYAGKLSAGKALLVGATAATGTTSAGAITVTATAVPIVS